jgi:hypothetical protein
MQIVRVRSWSFSYCEARYYGWRHSVQIGPWLIFFGQATEDATHSQSPRPGTSTHRP